MKMKNYLTFEFVGSFCQLFINNENLTTGIGDVMSYTTGHFVAKNQAIRQRVGFYPNPQKAEVIKWRIKEM